MTKVDELSRKLFNSKAYSIDEDAKSVTFIISTNDEDRYGEVVDQESWNFKSYQSNPIVLWGHDPDQPENVLGRASDIKTSDDGSKTTAVLTFDSDINPKADLAFNQIRKGSLRTVSVGFIPHTMEFEDDTPVLKDNELLEISVVPIPANAGAVALDLKAGQIARKDAEWLRDSMAREVELMDVQLAATKPAKEKTMTDEQAAAMIQGIADLKTENQELRAEIAALKPAEETDEERTAREAKEAADQAEADKKAVDDAEAAKKAQEDANVAAGLNPDGSAKGGDNDQPGAGTNLDELADDAELTPEQEAELDKVLDEIEVPQPQQ